MPLNTWGPRADDQAHDANDRPAAIRAVVPNPQRVADASQPSQINPGAPGEYTLRPSDLGDGWLDLRFRYDPERVRVLKRAVRPSQRRWNPTRKCWQIRPSSERAVHNAFNWVEQRRDVARQGEAYRRAHPLPYPHATPTPPAPATPPAEQPWRLPEGDPLRRAIATVLTAAPSGNRPELVTALRRASRSLHWNFAIDDARREAAA